MVAPCQSVRLGGIIKVIIVIDLPPSVFSPAAFPFTAQ